MQLRSSFLLASILQHSGSRLESLVQFMELLISWTGYPMSVNSSPYNKHGHIIPNNITMILLMSCTFMILFNVVLSLVPIQYASASTPFAQIFFVKLGNNVIQNGDVIKVEQGQTAANIYFQFKGYDEDDHIKEFICSFNSEDYQKDNCPTIGPEYQEDLPNGIGIPTTYNAKTGSTTHTFPVRMIPSAHTFGVKVVTDTNKTSAPATFTFTLRSSTPSEPPQTSLPQKYNVRVHLDSITIHNDHDGFWRGKGEFENYAFIQGKSIKLNMHVDSGQTIFFDPNNQFSVSLDDKTPLSIFTAGIEQDDCVKLSGSTLSPYPVPAVLTELYQNLQNPDLDHLSAVKDAQAQILKHHLKTFCRYDKLGTMIEFYDGPSYGAGRHTVKSSSGDFTLRYDIFSSPAQP